MLTETKRLSTAWTIKHLRNAKDDALVKPVFCCYGSPVLWHPVLVLYSLLYIFATTVVSDHGKSYGRQDTIEYWGHNVAWDTPFLYLKIMLTSLHSVCSFILMWI